MSAILSSQGVAVATAMAVSAGTVILLAFHLQKFSPIDHRSQLRSCLSSGHNKKEKKKKRVQFAEDVNKPRRDGEEFRKQLQNKNKTIISSSSLTSQKNSDKSENGVVCRGMPANRIALYSGILRDRVVHRLAFYSC